MQSKKTPKKAQNPAPILAAMQPTATAEDFRRFYAEDVGYSDRVDIDKRRADLLSQLQVARMLMQAHPEDRNRLQAEVDRLQYQRDELLRLREEAERPMAKALKADRARRSAGGKKGIKKSIATRAEQKGGKAADYRQALVDCYSKMKVKSVKGAATHIRRAVKGADKFSVRQLERTLKRALDAAVITN
jgi:hypothetical protein